MNRAHKRAQGKGKVNSKDHKQSVLHGLLGHNRSQAFKEASAQAFELMLAIPTMILRDKFDFSKEQSEYFIEKCLYYYDSFEKGLITMEELHECLFEEAGIKIEKGG